MGFHVQKHVALTWFENVSRLKNIASIRSYLFERDKTIIRKKVSTTQFSINIAIIT
jgi:hypothetical protein